MDLLDLLRLLFRRWYVTTPVVLLTIGGAIAIGMSIQPDYKGSAAVLLVPPTMKPPEAPKATPQPGNPWLEVGENAMAQAIQIAVSAHDARTAIAAGGGDPGYQVTLITRSSILTIDIASASRARALVTIKLVTKLIGDAVAEQQAAYKPRPGEQITTEVLDPGLNITQSRSTALRVQIVVALIGLLLASAAAVGWDAVARRRATRRLAGRHGGGTPAGDAGQASVQTRRPAPRPAAAPHGMAPPAAAPHGMAPPAAAPHGGPPLDSTLPIPVGRIAPVAPAARTRRAYRPDPDYGRAPRLGDPGVYATVRSQANDDPAR